MEGNVATPEEIEYFQARGWEYQPRTHVRREQFAWSAPQNWRDYRTVISYAEGWTTYSRAHGWPEHLVYMPDPITAFVYTEVNEWR